MAWFTSKRERSRLRYLFACVGIILSGLASRHLPADLQTIVGKYPGDALWSLMVYFGLGAIFTEATTRKIAAGALSFSLFIEALKLYQAPWSNAIRHTTLGHLVFGHVFSWQNVVAYAAGVLAGVILEFSNKKKHFRRRRSQKRLTRSIEQTSFKQLRFRRRWRRMVVRAVEAERFLPHGTGHPRNANGQILGGRIHHGR